MSRLTLKDLKSIRDKAKASAYPGDPKVKGRVAIHLGTCGVAAGAEGVRAAFVSELEGKVNGDIELMTTGCAGYCSAEPMVTVELRDRPPVVYGGLNPKKVAKIVEQHVLGGEVVKKYALSVGEAPAPFFEKQRFIVLKNKGLIDPDRIEHYFAQGGYSALEKALGSMTPDAVIEEITRAGLRGRGGAGFPTGRKWRFCRDQKRTPKYLVANCDEGDPGAYMDRSLLESDPHAVLEGMVIAGYAIGAKKGYAYIRSEYPLAVSRMRAAIGQARDRGLLGKQILGSDFDFEIEVREGSGAFVCGEETSLIHSIQGDIPEPRQRPPYPVEVGVWGCPTVINNVETLANVPVIIDRTADWYAKIGTENSKGTKVFSLVGKIDRAGLIEVPMGITLREIIYDVGGGIKNGKELKAIQTGGPSGGCIPSDLIDRPVDYESLKEAGSMMGSGGMIVMDEETCMVDVAKFFVDFTADESCGKCSTCRDGSQALLEVLSRITSGRGKAGDIEYLEELGEAIKDGSMCGLGSTLPNPVLSTLRYYKDEYLAHIEEQRCPSLVCKDLIRYTIVPELCVGCLVCLKNCPTQAIKGEHKYVHVIDQSVCNRCGTCLEVCPPKVSAVIKVTGEEARTLRSLEKPVSVEAFRSGATRDQSTAH